MKKFLLIRLISHFYLVHKLSFFKYYESHY